MSAPTLTTDTDTDSTAQAPAIAPAAGKPDRHRSPATAGGLSRIKRGALSGGRALWRTGAILLFLLLWEFGPLYLPPASTRVFLPPLHDVLAALGSLIAKGQLQNHLGASLTRSASGFGIAVVSAVVLG